MKLTLKKAKELMNGFDGSLHLCNTDITSLPDNLIIEGGLDLSHTPIKKLPNDLKVYGDLDLGCTPIKKLPNGLVVNENLYLRNTKIKELPNALVIKRGLDLSYTPIKKLPNGLVVGTWLDLQGTSIEELPNGLVVNGDLVLRNTQIKKLPNDLRVNGNIYYENTNIPKSEIKKVKKLKNGEYEKNKWLYADGILTHIVCDKELTINNEKYRYYKGKFKSDNVIEKTYKRKRYFTHCENLKDGIEEVNFKIASENFDKNKIAQDIKDRNNIMNWIDYRLITGACSKGTKGWIASENLTTETTMPIKDFYEKYKDRKVYAFNRFEDFYNNYFG